MGGATAAQDGGRIGRRVGLVVATGEYDDPALGRLRSPAGDAAALRDLLADPTVGGFDVDALLDAEAGAIRLAVEELVAGRHPDDVLLLYLSCHGLVDLRRRLYFAARDTRKDRLASSGVSSQWVLEQLDDCRARRQVVLLDCCFSGAFASGAKGDDDLDLGGRLLGQGRGRVVLTASRATEYSFEGEPVDPGAPGSGSVFTRALLDGISTGGADTDGDGLITVDDAYAYAYDRVRASASAQTPQRWLYGAEGSIVLARSARSGSGSPAPAADGVPPAIPAEAPTGAAPGLPDTASPSRDGPARRRRVVTALAAGLVLAVVVAVALLVTSMGDGTSGDDSSTTLGAAASGTITATAPWRLVVTNHVSGDEGDGSCRVTLTDRRTGTEQELPPVFGDKTFQWRESGAFAWTSDPVGCEPFARRGAGRHPLPYVLPGHDGDSDGFSTRGRRLDVLWTAPDGDCTVTLRSVETGQKLDEGTVDRSEPSLTLDPGGPGAVYVEQPTCGLRLTVHETP